MKYLFRRFQLHTKLVKYAKRNTIIIVFANMAYLNVLENWLYAINKLELSNYLVVSIDKQLHIYLKERNIPTYLLQTKSDMKSLWINRVKLFRDILNLGYNFIHSDADAIWLRNPVETFFTELNYDVVFSQGTVWPEDTYEKNGFVLCCGYFGIKSNVNTINLLEDVYLDSKITGDDQVSFNHVINRGSIKWHIDQSYEMMFRDKRLKCSKDIIRGNKSNISIALLPHHLFQRINVDDVEAYVKHLLSEKKSDSVIDVLKLNNLLFIKD
jgi:hypothetical protein